MASRENNTLTGTFMFSRACPIFCA